MSPLFLHCVLCGRKQADGLLSRGRWGHLEHEDGAALQVCPTCRGEHPDWAERVRPAATGLQPAPGG